MIQPSMEIELPDYNVFYFSDNFYKVIRFNSKKRCKNELYHQPRSDSVSKLDAAISRARRSILDYCLSNDFKYFFTGTISPEKGDRFDLHTHRSRLSQFMRDQRKKYLGTIKFLFVPEQHENGAWHFHGVLDIPSSALAAFDSKAPISLQQGPFLNWPDYQNSFGFCSLSPIRDKIACAFYISKYISKDISSNVLSKGSHLFFASQGLKKPILQSSVYGSSKELDDVLKHHYEFCSTGYCKTDDWTFGLDSFTIFDTVEFVVDDLEEMENVVYEQTSFL